MDSVSPVLTAAEIPAEQVVALDQHQYLPIIVARITHMGVEIHLGMTDTAEEGGKLYADAAAKMFGEFARTKK